MLAFLFLVLIALWFLEYFHIEGLTPPYFIIYNLSGQPISLWVILILIVVLLALFIAPTPNKLIAAFLLLFWVLTVIGIITVSIIPLANILILGIIVVFAFGLLNPGEV